MNTGVTRHKNALGYLCLVLGFVLFWSFIKIWRQRLEKGGDRRELYIHGILLLMIGYLFAKANSMTSLGSFIIGVCVLTVLGLPFFRRNINHLGSYVVWGPLLLSPLMLMGSDFIVSKSVEATGHDLTFWGRVELWKNIISLKINPLIGTGYESFWNGKWVEKIWELY